MDALQLYMSYTVLTILACSVATVAVSFSSGSTSRQIALIGELRTSIKRALQICERARATALWSAGDTGRFIGMVYVPSLPPDPQDSVYIEQANHLIRSLASASVDRSDLRVSALRRQIAEIKRIEADGHALLSVLEASKKPVPVDAKPETHPAERFQRLVAFQ